MQQATDFVENNKSMLTTVAFIVVILLILYAVYSYLYPAADPTYVQFLQGEADARKTPIPVKGSPPAIYTGGDFTLSFWIYIDDWNYRTSKYKFLFALSPQHLTAQSRSPLVGVLTPLKNGLMVRGNVRKGGEVPVGPVFGSSPSSAAGPDINEEQNLQSLMNQQTSTTMFESTVGDAPCDVKDVPLQRWVCVTIVSSGRVLDVYMDGKLSRSCVLDNVITVPRGNLQLRLGDYGGFGGRYSSVQMWGTQLTPDVIYGIYQMGPTQTQHNIFTDLSKWLNLNVSFTGSAPGQPIQINAPNSPFGNIGNSVTNAYNSAASDVTQAYNSVQGQSTALISRF
jgi:hypothetical protein